MSDEKLERTRTVIRDWTRRPTCRSPAVARTRVLARLEEAGRLPGWGMAAAATAVIAMAIVLLVGVPRKPSESLMEPVAEVRAIAPRQAMLVYELSSGTKLYFSLAEASPAAPRDGQGEGS